MGCEGIDKVSNDNTVFDDFDLTEDEERQLREGGASTSKAASAVEDDDEFSDINGDESAKKPAEAEPEPEPEPGESADSGESDDDFAAFAEKHKGKSPEEILRIAYQQDRARAQARHEAKEARREGQQAAQTLQQLIQRIEQARQQKVQDLAQRRQQFDAELRDDPDAATRRLHDQLLVREHQEFEKQAWAHYVREQTRLARESIPDFDAVAPQLIRYGVEEAGYTEDEVRNAADHRDIILLNKARMFDALVKQGVVDPTGKLKGADAQSQQRSNLQRAGNIASKAPRTLSDARGARAADGAQSLVAKARELADMSDDLFMQMDDRELDRVLRELSNRSA